MNRYLFHTSSYGEIRSTRNSGINLKGHLEYYGVPEEVIVLKYLEGNSVALFNCNWKDVIGGIVKHPTFDLIDIKVTSSHIGDDVFILASQMQQVCMN